ncbi:hypothetical protein CDL12_00405 [Handroanthus impetiginosus]|uniref:Uncharacterized protein n=1 Tax=Handroanthus impetiginosus TaxID=429701 RepID=A0A2G9IAQ5_9LAMI|nr:hypothetical protein CDL12_00405 [Handroanthus impetiginosus]
MAGTSLKPLSPSEWESLIDDYNLGGAARLHRWTGGAPVFDLCLSALIRKDFPIQLKHHLLTFLEHHSIEESSPPSSSSLLRLLDALRAVIQSPTDPFALKEQFLISTTSIFITSQLDNDDLTSDSPVTGLVELLLTIINRPNHSLDRHTRGVACECLRQLELAFPCLLSEITPHLWSLCQSERTHVSQWYVLLLSTAILNVVKLKPSDTSIASISNATTPLIPFNVPQFFIDGVGGDFTWKENEICYKELRRVVAFLLDCPQYLTPFGLMEFMVAIIPVAEELELQASLLMVQFSWLLYTMEPLLCHVFLGMYLKFLNSFEGQEFEVAFRILLLSKESQQHLVFRLLGLHWMLGFFGLIVVKDEARKRSILDMSLSFYPAIFDSLAMKALKLDLLAYCSSLLRDPGNGNGVKGVEADKEVYEVKLFKDGLISVSAFKWLPPWSTETAVAFRTFHKFLIGGSPHSDASSSSMGTLIESSIFNTLQKMIVASTSEFKGLVPVIVACIDRLLGCNKHRLLGEHLLETLDKHLLPKLKKDYSLGAYFPIFERISENDKVSPSGLLKLLRTFTIFLVEEHGPDTGMKSWHHGSKILGICLTMLIHHLSSSLFTGLPHLLAFTCLYFPDLEVRDNARFYLRMLICIPGKKLKHILNMGENLPGISPSPHSGTFFSLQSHSLPVLKRSSIIASYIHIERVLPLLVKQSWSLSLPILGFNPDIPGFFEGIRDNEPAIEERDSDGIISGDVIQENEILHQQKQPLRVMDAKISEIVWVLRRHFSYIPDYRHMPGLKIKISCSLRFDSEPFSGMWKVDNELDGVDKLPALYATVLKFYSSAPYGPILSFHIPFLLGSPPKKDKSLSQTDSLAIVPVENGRVEEDDFKAPVCVELEPREPMPGLVDVFIEANADNGQIIKGQLNSISVGIEDMFLRAIVPDDITKDAVPSYYVDLFNALWEACETSSSTGRETFVLKGGKGVAAISGTRSVKLVEVPVTSLVKAVERHLAPYVVCVIGEPLVNMVKVGGVIKDMLWKDCSLDCSLDDVIRSPTSSRGGPLYLEYFGDEDDDSGGQIQGPTSRSIIGYFHILIFLPPRFHLLFQMELREFSTLVRIRTDHWPCLAYVDDYLEGLFLD